MNSQSPFISDTSKVLLGILPFWDPMIPPNGIAHLKSYLQKNGYKVRTFDAIVEETSQLVYNNYFKVLEECIPDDHKGNFYNIGHDVMQDHMMAHFNYDDVDEYIEVVKLIIFNTYYTKIEDCDVKKLNNLLDQLYDFLVPKFFELIEQERPFVVGFTTYKQTLPSSLYVLKKIKEKYPSIKTVIGGGTFVDVHTIGTPNFDRLISYTEGFVDKIIIGQGELLLLKYLREELPDSQRVFTKKDINSEILQFSETDIPDFSDFDLSKYPYLVGTGSSSCPYECSFCCARNFYGNYREKEVVKTVDEMIRLHKKHGHQLFFMTDSLVNPIITDMAIEFIKSKISLYYDVYYRVDKQSGILKNTLLWRKGGLYRVRLGCESGSENVLNMMGKAITPEEIKNTTRAMALAGIKTTTYWVVGHPGETEDDFQKTLDLIYELKDDIYQAECNPFLYYYSTQTKSGVWSKKSKYLYPDFARKLIIFDTWTLDIDPLRMEVYSRMYRFNEFCMNHNIPNPYSYNEYLEADKRWQKLHKNSVPQIFDFISREKYIDENQNIELVEDAVNQRNTLVNDFNF